MTINANVAPATFETFWASFPDVHPVREKGFPHTLKSIMDKGVRSQYAVAHKPDSHRDIVLERLAGKFREPVVIGYHDNYEILFGLEEFRAGYKAGYGPDDFVVLKFDATPSALKAAALAHEFRGNRKFPFGELVKVVASEGLEFIETYGEFLKASNSDLNTLRTAYAHGLEGFITEYPIAVLKGVLKNRLPLILAGRVDAKSAFELEAESLKNKNTELTEEDPALRAALARANKAEKKADAMDAALRGFMEGLEGSGIPKRYRATMLDILKEAVANNPAS